MTATVSQARNEMHALFKAAWEAEEISRDLPVLYGDVPGLLPPSEGNWARITVQHQEGFQATLSGATGNRRFRRLGVVTVQVFTEFGDGQVDADALGIITKNTFEGEVTSPGRVIFRNVRLNEVGQDGQWFQTNVLADFEYDEVR